MNRNSVVLEHTRKLNLLIPLLLMSIAGWEEKKSNFDGHSKKALPKDWCGDFSLLLGW